MFSPGPTELLIILAIILVIFGAGKAPSVIKAMGEGVREFRGAVSGANDTKGDAG